jgi:hypothetical protein
VVVEEVEVEAILVEKVLGKPKKRGVVLLVLAANAEVEDEAPDEEEIEVVHKGRLNNNQPNEVLQKDWNTKLCSSECHHVLID